MKVQAVTSHRFLRRQGGVVVMWALVVLSVLTVLTGVTTWQFLASRRSLIEYEHRLQTLWFARAGCEQATAKLLTYPDGYAGEKYTPTPLAEVHITVAAVPGEANVFRVTSEARYPTNIPRPVVRSLVRSVKRVVGTDGVSRIEMSSE